MIIVKLMGGIGNQMFQYAAARRLAHFRRTELKLDISSFNNIAPIDTLRKYELGVFNIRAHFAASYDIPQVRIAALFGKYGILLTHKLPFLRRYHIVEKHYHFDQDILTLHDNVCLEGYWQSERYFADTADILRKDFPVKTRADDSNLQVAEKISRAESVSLHIRRGDYVSNTATSSYHGTCSLEYYRAAVQAITARADTVHFFLFSDDAEWVRKNMAWIGPMTVIDINGPDKAYEDMRLMSLCKHHIIANSSFSWWGAWLSTNPHKIVIAPKKWFNNDSIDTRDLIPQTWTRI